MITKTHKGERLLEIDNVHVTDCGPPPSLDATDKYVGYFENPHGEQWVFIGDRSTAPPKSVAEMLAGRQSTTFLSRAHAPT